MKKAVLIIFELLTITIITGMVLTSSSSHAETTSANASVTVAEACTMTATVNSAHSATINPGQYLQPIGETVLKVICNDAGGYAIYAVGNANNEYGNNKLLANVGGSLNSTYDIATGTATSGSASNWAMKVSAVSGSYAPTIQNSFSSYHNVPTTYTKVAQLNSMTDATAGSSVSTTYAAYVKSDQPAGSYNGKVKYTMVHPTTETPVQPQTTQAGKICYYPNGSNVEGTMGCQTVSTSATSATLLASNFSRAGYGFAGWSKTFDYSDDTGFLGPQETITFTAGQYTGSNPGLSLYARWIKSAGSLQGWTGCSSLQSGAVTALTDQRDNETYAVAKLADGNCWTIENLRLADKDSSNNDVILSSTNTNNPSLPLTNIYDTSSTSNHLSPTSSIAYAADTAPEGWCTTNSSACDDQSRIRTDNTANRATYTSGQTVSSQDANLYSYGNYYNWYSATAGNGTYSESSGEVAGDLCPSGWRLPYGKSSGNGNTPGGFYYLNYKLNNDSNITDSTASNKLRAYPNNFLYSGFVGGISISNRGINGYSWSSTADGSNSANHLNFYSTTVSPGTGVSSKYYGRPVRCIAPSS